MSLGGDFGRTPFGSEAIAARKKLLARDAAIGENRAVTFTPDVYEQIRAGAQRSAAVIVPLALQLFEPKTVLDVGAGEGWFSRAFAEVGCSVVALDESVPAGDLPLERLDGGGSLTFRHADLAAGDAWASASVEADLVVCLEVAEHLSPGAADAFVATLCALAPVVLFSAAVPGQGGHGHLNEQWPAYWAERFRSHGRLVSGGLRWHLWESGVEPWYAQNLLVAATDVAAADVGDRAEIIGSAPEWADWLFEQRTENEPLPLVHPTTFSYWVDIAKGRR